MINKFYNLKRNDFFQFEGKKTTFILIDKKKIIHQGKLRLIYEYKNIKTGTSYFEKFPSLKPVVFIKKNLLSL